MNSHLQADHSAHDNDGRLDALTKGTDETGHLNTRFLRYRSREITTLTGNMAPKIWIASTLLALSTFAFSTDSTTMNITLSIPGTQDCGTTSSEAVSFSLTNTPTTTHCFNLNSTFASPQSNSTTSNNNNNTSSVAGFIYTLSGNSHFDDSRNYSQVFYLQPSTTSSGSGNLTLKTYNGLDCVQVAESDGLIEPWTEWTCSTSAEQGVSPGECTTLPYSVRSFEIGPVGEKQKGEECVVAAAYGKENAAGRKRIGSAGGVVVGAALGLALLMRW